MFSKTLEHAIKAVVFVAKHSLDGNRVNLKEIAAGIDSPVAFTAKILQVLARNGFIYSIKGAHGGFEMETSTMKKLALLQVVTAVDGDHIQTHCAMGLKNCSGSNPCPFHERYAPVRRELILVLETTSIYDMAIGLITGKSSLKA